MPPHTEPEATPLTPPQTQQGPEIVPVLKHAAASRVDGTLMYEPGQIRLKVVDDGHGFDPKAVVRGYGLENMNKRTEELDGSVTIESTPGTGTSITVTLPV